MVDEQVEKIKIYKDQIIQEYIKQGIYPTDDIIKSRLDKIDLSLALFKHTHINKGDNFNTDDYNNAIKYIYLDLVILYKILYDITAQQFIDIKSFADSHLESLEDTVMQCKKKADIELNTSLLGDTLSCITSNYNIETFNSLNVVELDQISIPEGSDIACIADILNISADSIWFELRENPLDYSNINNPTGFYKRSNVYNYNQDFISIPYISGSSDVLYDIYTVTADQLGLSSSVKIPMDNLDVSAQYEIFSGKDKVILSTFDSVSSNNYSVSSAELPNTVCKDNSVIEFYILNGDSITFNFDKKPTSTNFTMDTNNTVSNLDSIQYFRIVPAANSTLYFTITKGNLFACKQDGVVNDGTLYCPNSYNLTDFQVLKKAQGDSLSLYPYVIIVSNEKDIVSNIESITIKKIN